MREHDRKEAEHEQAQAASVTELSEEQQIAASHESAEQAATTVTEVDNQARQDSARAIQPIPGLTGEVMMVCS